MEQATQARPGIPDFPALREDWITWMRVSRNLSPNTIRLYTRTVDKAHAALGDLPTQTTASLERWIQTQRGQAGTVANRISALVSFYRFLVKSKRIPANPATELDRPKQHKGVPKPVTDLEVKLALLDKADEEANHWHDRRVGETRDMAVFLCETGLRIHEAVKCDWPVPCPAEALIVGKGNKEAMVQLTPKAREAWDRLGGKWPIGARATQRRFERAGMHPHACRHWRATSLVQAGVEIGVVSKIMRHSNVATTMGYSAYAQDQMRDALARVTS